MTGRTNIKNSNGGSAQVSLTTQIPCFRSSAAIQSNNSPYYVLFKADGSITNNPDDIADVVLIVQGGTVGGGQETWHIADTYDPDDPNTAPAGVGITEGCYYYPVQRFYVENGYIKAENFPQYGSWYNDIDISTATTLNFGEMITAGYYGG